MEWRAGGREGGRAGERGGGPESGGAGRGGAGRPRGAAGVGAGEGREARAEIRVLLYATRT